MLRFLTAQKKQRQLLQTPACVPMASVIFVRTCGCFPGTLRKIDPANGRRFDQPLVGYLLIDLAGQAGRGCVQDARS